MTTPSLQDGIDNAGGPIKLLWRPDAPLHKVPVVPPEFVGWRKEQAAWLDGVAFSDLSHHMSNLFIEGPDSLRLLSAVSANDYEKFAVGQAKQFIPVTPEGKLIMDAILFRTGEEEFNLVGGAAAHNWVMYHGQKGNYNIKFQFDPTSAFRQGKPPVQFRFQVQGPRAGEVIERALGGPLPKMKFFHFQEVSIAGRPAFAFRHGMNAQSGCEFFGSWEHSDAVMEELLKAGEPTGMVRVGGDAYFTNALESGWIPMPVPGIYTSPALVDYRRHLGLQTFEGRFPLKGSFYSENLEDYYVSPWEIGYGRSISLNHDFIGREALAREQENVQRTRVTIVWDPNEVKRVFGADHGYQRDNVRDRIEIGGKMVGITQLYAYIDPYSTILSIALVNKEHATPGTEVTVVFGNHPGHTGAAENYSYVKATIQPSPYTEYARTQYRAGAAAIA